MPLLWEEDEEEEEKPPPIWFEFVDSGLCSTIIFFVAMVLCLWTVPLGYGNADQVALSFRVTVWYCSLFVVESGIDLGWGLYRWRLDSRIELMKTVSELFPTSYCAPWLDAVHWDVWSAVGFMIGSIFYLVAAVFDERAGYRWMEIVRYTSLSDADIVDCCNQAGAWIFLLDSIICVVGRWTYRRTIAPKQRLILVQFWRVRGFFQLAWAAWADIFFLIGALASIVSQYDPDSHFWNWSSELLWTLDAIAYVIGCMPCFIAATRARADVHVAATQRPRVYSDPY